MTTQKCRTCLKSSTKTFPLTNPAVGCTPNITYGHILKEYAKFEYNSTYELHLPQFLCFLCCSQLKSTYLFIQQAQHANSKLINDLTTQHSLQEQVIDLPQLKDEATVTIINNENLYLENEYNFTPKDHKDNLVTNKSFISEPNLATKEIIEYDSDDVLSSNNSFIEEPTLTTEDIIKYDIERIVEIDNENFNSDLSEDYKLLNVEEKDGVLNKIEVLQSEESLLETNLSDHKSSSKEQIFKCKECPEKYKSKCEYLHHIKEEHNKSQEESVEYIYSSNKILKCQFCDFIAKSSSSLKYHNRSKHGTDKDKLKCQFCSYTCLNKSYLFNHVKNVHKELIKTIKANAIIGTNERINSSSTNNINCSTINLILPTDEENISDINDEQSKEGSSDEEFIRNIINMKKRPRKNMSTNALVTRCEECGKIFKNNKSLSNHQRHVHKSEDMFSVCPHCDKKCKRETDLKIHIRQIHGPIENRQVPKPRSREKRFMCAECSYTCTTSTILNIHIRVHHTGERPYKCDICSKSFVVQHDLRIHRYSHTGEKPYQCHICLKNFRDPSYVRKHARLHTNKYPFKCEDCGKGFTQSYTLSLHKRTHLIENKLSCHVCGKLFQNKSMLNIHQINENHCDEVA